MFLHQWYIYINMQLVLKQSYELMLTLFYINNTQDLSA